VNHLPWITELRIEGDDGFARLRQAIEEREEAAFFPRENALKLAMLDRFGALPGAGDRHVAEFFPGILTEETGWGDAWGIHLTSIDDRERDETSYRADLAAMAAGTKPMQTWQSGELVAPLIDSLLTGTRRSMPLNIPNAGQAPYLPHDVVVETMCDVDDKGIRGAGAPEPPDPCAAWTRRHVDVQELTVEAAVTGDRGLVHAALALDPLAGRIDWRDVEAMGDALLAATARWLPQFA
jgi:alpha-galactosidase